jgi:hypothetical protein
MKKLKQVLSVCLALCLAIAVFPTSAFATTSRTTFTDVSPSAWYYEGVQYAYNMGWMNGTGSSTFSPNAPITRGAFALILYKMNGSPAVYNNPFTDVSTRKDYTDAITWVNENNIMNGTGNSKFSPDGVLTREQFATILYRYSQFMDYDTSARGNISNYSDGGKVSSWAKEGMRWAVGDGIISGVGNNTIAPSMSTSRAQAAVILMRLNEKQGDPYYGDISKCNMSAEQALAYAQLLSNGIAGNLTYYDGNAPLSIVDSKSIMDWSSPWDITPVVDNAIYAQRNYALLCDFAGDGNPYLLLCNKNTSDSTSGQDFIFSVYGWQNGKLQCLAEQGTLRYSHFDYFTLLDNGIRETVIKITEDGDWPTVNTDYRFVNGGIELSETSLGNAKAIESAMGDTCTLREMIVYLNKYAASVGSSASVSTSPCTSKQLMAKAMWSVINNSDLNIYYEKLLDMNGDGTKELIIGAFAGTSYSYYSLPYCMVYQWNGSQLIKVCEGWTIDQMYSLVRAKSGEYYIDYRSTTDEEIHDFESVTGSEIYSHLYESTRYTLNGKTISKAEYDKGIAKYTTVESIYEYGKTSVTYEEWKSVNDELMAMITK